MSKNHSFWFQSRRLTRYLAIPEPRLSCGWAKKTACSDLGPSRLSQDPSICHAVLNVIFEAPGLPRLADGV